MSTWLYTRINEWTRKRDPDAGDASAARSRGSSASIGRTDKDVQPEPRDLDFRHDGSPDLSVIVVARDGKDRLLACLRSIAANRPAAGFEVVVVDDGATERTLGVLDAVEGIELIANDQGPGFLTACNTAAARASGDLLCFLDGNVRVLPGWLDELHRTFTDIPDAGLVGSMVLDPDGRLLAAGGAIGEPGSGTGPDRGDDPDRPECNFVRDADHCSSASVMIPARVFRRLEGPGERIASGGHRDAELARSVREMGLRVIHQPFSRVIHFGDIAPGTDGSGGRPSSRAIGSPAFRGRRTADRVSRRAPGPAIGPEPGGNGARALVIDFATPRPDTDSASIDTVHYLKMLQHLGYRVSFIANDLEHSGKYTEALQRLGVQCLYRPYVESVGDYLRQHGSVYRLVFMQRVHYAKEYFDQARRFCTNARLIFNTVDLHYVREQRYAELENSDLLRRDALSTRSIELGIIRDADATIVISQEEKRILERDAPDSRVFCIPYVRQTRPTANDFGSRRDIVFIGGFDHLPNIDAVHYFAHQVFPLVRNALPDVVFRIVGSNIPGMVFKPDEVNALAAQPGVEIVGFVDELDGIFDRCRLSVAPLRFGAGIKGKIGTSLCYGVPCVATAIAVEGMDLEHRKNILIADRADQFANEVIRLYTDEALWNGMSRAGIAFMKQHYSFENGVRRLRGMIETIDRDHPFPAI